MRFNIAINGYGRIGRCILRALYESIYRDIFNIVAVNEIADIETMAHLTRYDTIHGRFFENVTVVSDTQLKVAGDDINVFHHDCVDQIPWSDVDVDVVMECTGVCNTRKMAEQHIRGGAGAVIFSQPADTDVDATIVYGINHHLLTSKTRVISNASCTSNCVVPVIRVIDTALGVESGVITTIHSMMNDQPVIDAYHHADLRRTRAAGCSITPIKTELAYGIGKILPHLSGAFESISVRVPTINVSAMDIVMRVSEKTTAASVNRILAEAAEGELAGILGYTETPLVSNDFNHDTRSSIVDGTQTRVSKDRLLKIFCFFDNEWGYANRMLDTALAMLTAIRHPEDAG